MLFVLDDRAGADLGDFRRTISDHALLRQLLSWGRRAVGLGSGQSSRPQPAPDAADASDASSGPVGESADGLALRRLAHDLPGPEPFAAPEVIHALGLTRSAAREAWRSAQGHNLGVAGFGRAMAGRKPRGPYQAASGDPRCRSPGGPEDTDPLAACRWMKLTAQRRRREIIRSISQVVLLRTLKFPENPTLPFSGIRSSQ